jgi:hypothetical protein
MLAQGDQFWNIPWMEDTGWNIPFIQNSMPVHCFDQICRYLHFVDNKKLGPEGHHKWNPLQKIHPFMIKMLVQFQLGYILEQFITVNESMIKYKGKQIRFIQYMPAKPLKHQCCRHISCHPAAAANATLPQMLPPLPLPPLCCRRC